MTDDNSPTDTPRAVPLEPAGKRRGLSGISFIWAIPALAILAAIGVAWQNYTSRGPLIEVVFTQADGVRAQETELRYRDIPVGVVESVGFNEGHDKVVVGIRLDKEMAPYVDTDSQFWIVRPQVTAQGVTGLDTVLSGVYISGAWDGVPGEVQESFEGASEAPLLALGESGITFRMRSIEGLPTENTPILYRGVVVGRLGATEISEDGLQVFADAVILEPYTRLVTSASRFWDISGFSFSIGAQGAAVDFSSLASLISGGITFETLASGGDPLAPGAEYVLHPDEEVAREDFFLEGDGGSVGMMMIFDENLAGLQAGAPITLGGLRIGEVETIAGLVDRERFGDNEVRLMATARLNPSRLGLTDVSDEAFFDYLDARIAEGLRAQLTNASLLTGGLKVDLVLVEDAAPAALDRAADPFPRLPTTPSAVTNVAASAQGLIQRVDALPVEEVMQGIVETLADIRTVIGSEEVQATPEALLATLESIRAVAESEEIAALPGQIGTLSEGLVDASAQLNTILTQVEDEAVVAAIAELIASLDATAQTLPALSEQAGAVLAKAEDLPLEDIAAQVSAILTDEDLTALPADIRATVTGVRTLVESDSIAALPAQIGTLSEGLVDASAQLNTILTQVEDEALVAAISELIASLDATAQTLPALSEQAGAVLAKAEELPLQDIAAQVSALLTDEDLTALPADIRATVTGVRTLVESEAIAALPAQIGTLTEGLNTASTTLNTILTEVQDEAVVAAVSELIAALDATAQGLPALSEQAGAVLAKAEALPLEDVTTRITSVLDGADEILADEDLRALPADVRATVDGLRQVVESEAFAALPAQVGALAGDLETAANTLNTLLAQAAEDRIVEQVSELIASLGTTADRLPGIADQASAVLSDAEELALDDLAAQARDLLASIDALVDQDDTRELPAEINDALAALRLTLTDVRNGGLIENANATLASARDAAEAVAQASRSLPDLSNRLRAVADQANVTLATYGRGSDFGRELSGALRQIEEAASAIDRLARQIARNPNSLITGR